MAQLNLIKQKVHLTCMELFFVDSRLNISSYTYIQIQSNFYIFTEIIYYFRENSIRRLYFALFWEINFWIKWYMKLDFLERVDSRQNLDVSF